MGARWAWTAVCSGPEHHVYSNFSGGADDCYECGAEPEVGYRDDMFDDVAAPNGAEEYAARRRAGSTVEQVRDDGELELLRELADRHGYRLESIR